MGWNVPGDLPYGLVAPKDMDPAVQRTLHDVFRQVMAQPANDTLLHVVGVAVARGRIVMAPETLARIQQYEMAYRMQTAVPDITDVSKEPDDIVKLYGPDCLIPGTFAANALLSRKLSENGVRFVQLYHQGWDQHGNLPNDIKIMAKSVDQPATALIKDLKQRGMLDETLVIWGGEFGRTTYSQGKLSVDNYGRDHHPRCFTVWMAGAGVKKGFTFGQTDDFGYNIAKDPVHVHDFQATIMHLMGINHEKFTFKHQGRYYRLTDVSGKVVKAVLA